MSAHADCILYSDTGDADRVQAGNYNTMVAEGDARRAIDGDEAVTIELYTGGVVDALNLICRWHYDADALDWLPSIPCRADRVTDSQFGEQDAISATSGPTRTMQPGHNLPLSGALTVWDRINSTAVGTAVAFTRVGDVLTLIDPGATTTGDQFLLEGTCEFGELREKSDGGLWSPRRDPGGLGSDILVYWDDGLVFEAGPLTIDDGVELSFMGKPIATQVPISVHLTAIIDVIEAGSGVDSKIGLGHSSANDFRCGGTGLLHRTAPNWSKLFFGTGYGAFTTLASTNFSGPGTTLGVRFMWCFFSQGDNSLVQYQCQTDFAPGNGIENDGVGAEGLGAGSTFGPADGVLLMLSLENGGAIAGRLKLIEAEWVSI